MFVGDAAVASAAKFWDHIKLKSGFLSTVIENSPVLLFWKKEKYDSIWLRYDESYDLLVQKIIKIF